MTIDKKDIYEYLEVLFNLISFSNYSNSYQRLKEEEKDYYRHEIVLKMDMLQDYFKVSNKTLNQVSMLASKHSLYKHSLKDFLKVGDIILRLDGIEYPKSVTI